MKKILFLIHDLGQGGAEKVLVNLVNNMDLTKFNITVMALFGGGVNEQFLNPEIRYITVFKKMIRGNSIMMKLLSPQKLHDLIVKDEYDVEISYLEGPCARIISGCKNPKTKLVSWIHVEQHTMKNLTYSFRNELEARISYNRFDQTVCVSEFVHNDFCGILNFKKPCKVLYNTVETDKILQMAKEPIPVPMKKNVTNIIAVGTLKQSKGYLRLLNIAKKLVEANYAFHLYILGKGPQEQELKTTVVDLQINNYVTFLGYDTNPYRYVASSDLFVCSSFSEGFSTAATEALIVGTPVCTVEVSGMKEMLGENNKYGIVTENSEQGLYAGIKLLLDNPEKLKYYQKQAIIRGCRFSTKNTVDAVERMLLSL